MNHSYNNHSEEEEKSETLKKCGGTLWHFISLANVYEYLIEIYLVDQILGICNPICH